MNGGSDGNRRGGFAPRRAAVVVLLATGLLAPGCGGTDDPLAQESAPKVTVVIHDGAYHPARVSIPVGGRVTWVNRDQAPNTAETDGVGFFEVDRDKLDRENRFDMHTIQQGEAESATFDTPGTYRYHSSLSSARGVVEVVAPTDG